MEKEIQYFIYLDGEFIPISSGDKRIGAWEPKKDITDQVLVCDVYPKDLHITNKNLRPKTYFRRNDEEKDEEGEKSKRGEIKKLSFNATKRFKFIIRNIIREFTNEITLTYPREYPMDGSLIKKQLHKFLVWLRYRGCRYAWVLEFQERGAPHFHILIDKDISYKDIAEIWYKIVGSDDEKHLQAGTCINPIRDKDAMAPYFTAYLSKAKQKQVPEEYKKVGRFWGYSKGLLKCIELRILTANLECMDVLKENLKIARYFDRGQKRIWERKRKERGGKKNKFKKFYHREWNDYRLKVTNSDKLVKELSKRGMELFPYKLLAVPPETQAELVRRDGSAGFISTVISEESNDNKIR